MKNQTLIYSIVLAFVFLISFSVLLVYYTQDYNLQINFKDTLNSQEINIQENTRGLTFNAILGQLTLENNGVFTTKYGSESFIGCINLKDNYSGTSKDSIENYNNVEIYFTDSSHKRYYTEPEVKPGETFTANIEGRFEYYYTGSPLILADVESISIYKIKEQAVNPFEERYTSKRCHNLREGESYKIIYLV